jgi:integrase
MLKVLKELAGDVTVHGFRSSFSDWARDRTGCSRDVVEQALGHAISDKTEAAYRRSDALEKRRKLMQMWSDFCTSTSAPISSSVIAFRG